MPRAGLGETTAGRLWELCARAQYLCAVRAKAAELRTLSYNIMELSDVRCSSPSDELYTINRTVVGSRPKRLLWQNAVRHITEQRFIHEQGGGARTISSSESSWSPGRRKHSAGKMSNNGSTKVFPERPSNDLGFLPMDTAPSNSDFFLNWGYIYRGVIFPTLRNSFKSRDLELLYQRYFLGQRRKSVIVINILDILTKLTVLILHLTLSLIPMDPVKGTLLGVFTGIEVVVCALVVVKKDTTSQSYLQYPGLLTWLVMTTQILDADFGYGLCGGSTGYVLFTLFATYSMLPHPLTWAILAGFLTSVLHLVIQFLTHRVMLPPTNQVIAQSVLFMCMNTAGIFISYLSDRAQRQAFLETRRCIEARLRLESENQRQVGAYFEIQAKLAWPLTGDMGFAGKVSIYCPSLISLVKVVVIWLLDCCNPFGSGIPTVQLENVKGFTNLSTTLSAQELVRMLNELFARFDRLAH
eukprot:g48538.t1